MEQSKKYEQNAWAETCRLAFMEERLQNTHSLCRTVPMAEPVRCLLRFVLACCLLSELSSGRLHYTRFEHLVGTTDGASIPVHMWGRVLYNDHTAMTNEPIYTWLLLMFVNELMCAVAATVAVTYTGLSIRRLREFIWLLDFVDYYDKEYKIRQTENAQTAVNNYNKSATSPSNIAHLLRDSIHSYCGIPVTEESQSHEYDNKLLLSPDCEVKFRTALAVFESRDHPMLCTYSTAILCCQLGWIFCVLVYTGSLVPTIFVADSLTLMKGTTVMTGVHLILTGMLCLCLISVGTRLIVGLILSNSGLEKTYCSTPGAPEKTYCSTPGAPEKLVPYAQTDERLLWTLWCLESVTYAAILLICISCQQDADLFYVPQEQIELSGVDRSLLPLRYDSQSDLAMRSCCWKSPPWQPMCLAIGLCVCALVIRCAALWYAHKLCGTRRPRWAFYTQHLTQSVLSTAMAMPALVAIYKFLKTDVSLYCSAEYRACDPTLSSPALAFWLDRTGADISQYVGSLSQAVASQFKGAALFSHYSDVLYTCIYRGAATCSLGEDTARSNTIIVLFASYMCASGIFGACFALYVAMNMYKYKDDDDSNRDLLGDKD